jgi:hypothetical protein
MKLYLFVLHFNIVQSSTSNRIVIFDPGHDNLTGLPRCSEQPGGCGEVGVTINAQLYLT